MSEGKEYVSQVEEQGSIHISEEVIASIAAVAAVEVDGVASLAANPGTEFAELLGRKNLSKGVQLQLNEGGVTAAVSVLVKYGYAIQDVAKAVQNAVMSSVEATTGLSVEAVDVHVRGIAFAKTEGK